MLSASETTAFAPPLADALDADALLRPFLAGRTAAVAAVSGGSDSLALLLLLDGFRRRAPDLLPTVVTVDHGLRAEAAEEARRVAEFAGALGLAHRTMRWEGRKPQTGVIAAARDARYRLLARAAGEAGADIVLTGHTGDDQFETVAMRMARGEGRGLAGMAPLTLHENRTWIARPLLGLRRETLRAFLRARGVAWVEDPSNDNGAFERARLRRNGPRPGAEVERVLGLARAAAAGRRAEAAAAAELVRAHASLAEPGLVRLAAAFAQTGSPGARLALRFLLATMGGRVHPVDDRRAGALLAALAGPGRWTLGGTLVERRRDAVLLRREMRGKVAPPPCFEPVVTPFRAFLPDFDLPLAEALAALVGAETLPIPPYRDATGEPRRHEAAASAWQGSACCLC